ncbi:MAG: TrmB family transcriptional regulator [Clostridiaceae bacterium]
MDMVELLKQFSLTRQEASIYLTLLSEGPLNGYEVAKITGISRSNAYTSLAALVEKGGAFVIEETAIRYTPVSLEEFCDNRIRRLQETKKELLKNAPEIKDEVEGYITIKGESHILDKLKNMIINAKQRIYLSISGQVLEQILPDIRNAAKKGLKVVLITNIPVHLDGATVYATDAPLKQIRLIADSANVLTGDIDNGEFSTCLYSRKKNLIDLFKDSMKNEIKLIEMMKGRNKA